MRKGSFYALAAIGGVCLAMVGCAADEGETGPAGTNGPAGSPGTPGAPGTPGPAGPAGTNAPIPQAPTEAPKAVYTLSNDATANTVVVYTRAADGTLTPRDSYPTGGRGTA